MAVCESTGGYERLLVSRLRKTEILMDIAHPSRVRAFARACGYEAKTDPQDALVLSRFGQVFPEQTPPGWELEPELEELQDLLRRRRQLVEQRVQELGRLDKGVAPAVAKSTKRHIVWPRLIRRASHGPTRRTPGPCRVWELDRRHAGSPLELGQGQQSSDLSGGRAPWSRDSGQKRGQRAIRGGRRVVRRALYICAWSVIRVDGQIRRFYQSLRQRGKPGKVALVAVMRKLLLQLNAVARPPWVAQTG